MTPGACSKCDGPLTEQFVCYSDVCGGPENKQGLRFGRYRHPATEDGYPCLCNQGHTSLKSGEVFSVAGKSKDDKPGDYTVTHRPGKKATQPSNTRASIKE
jgi:hypothetical protein